MGNRLATTQVAQAICAVDEVWWWLPRLDPGGCHALGYRNVAVGYGGEVQRIGRRLRHGHVAKRGCDAHHVNTGVCQCEIQCNRVVYAWIGVEYHFARSCAHEVLIRLGLCRVGYRWQTAIGLQGADGGRAGGRLAIQEFGNLGGLRNAGLCAQAFAGQGACRASVSKGQRHVSAFAQGGHKASAKGVSGGGGVQWFHEKPGLQQKLPPMPHTAATRTQGHYHGGNRNALQALCNTGAGTRQRLKFAFIDNEDINEVQQVGRQFLHRCGIEHYGHTLIVGCL